jgi:hypothetical protein
MFKEIIEREKISCTEQEFETYYNTVIVDTTELKKIEADIKEFTELYH